MKNRWLILAAKVISFSFSPFYMPMIAFFIMFIFSYLKLFPWQYKLTVLFWVYFYTVLIPWIGIYVYRKINGWTSHHLGKRTNRYVPYIISLCSYLTLLYTMRVSHMPHFTIVIIETALVLQFICLILNHWIKVSTHAAASAAVIGALCAFSLIFEFPPLNWLCLTIFLCGLVSTSRLILRQHKLIDIGLGTLLGLLCGFCCVMWI